MTTTIAAAFLANLAVAILWPNLGCSLVATLLFIVAAAKLFRVDPTAIWLLFPVVLTELSVLISLNVIDGGAYMLEMGQYGRPSAAAASFACYSLLLLTTSVAVFRRLVGASAPPGGPSAPRPGMHVIFQWALVLPCLACVAHLLLGGLRTGFPLLTGTDRFLFRRLYADAVTIAVLNLKVVMSCVLGVVAAYSDRRPIRVSAGAAFVGLMAVSFLYGDKFFIILESIGAFMLAFVIANPAATGRLLAKSAPVIGLGIAAVLAVTFFIYSDLGSRSLGGTLARLAERVAGQGELWLMAVEHSPRWIHFDSGLIQQNLASLFARNPQDFAFEHHLGAEYFSYRYSPPAMYRSFLHNAGYVTPTMGYEAYGLVIFGYIGLTAMMALTGVFLGGLMSYLYRTIARGELFAVVLPAFVLSEATKLLSQGTLYNILSVSTFKLYAAFFVVQCLAAVLSRGLNPGAFRNTAATRASPVFRRADA